MAAKEPPVADKYSETNPLVNNPFVRSMYLSQHKYLSVLKVGQCVN